MFARAGCLAFVMGRGCWELMVVLWSYRLVRLYLALWMLVVKLLIGNVMFYRKELGTI